MWRWEHYIIEWYQAIDRNIPLHGWEYLCKTRKAFHLKILLYFVWLSIISLSPPPMEMPRAAINEYRGITKIVNNIQKQFKIGTTVCKGKISEMKIITKRCYAGCYWQKMCHCGEFTELDYSQVCPTSNSLIEPQRLEAAAGATTGEGHYLHTLLLLQFSRAIWLAAVGSRKLHKTDLWSVPAGLLSSSS